MKDLNEIAFFNLFKQACEKGLGQSLQAPLSEPDSKLLSNKIVEQTGLVIGAKSIKNYSSYILFPNNVKKENPSVATLDTLARYVLDAPYTEETRRKDHEDHHPYWYQYRSRFNRAHTSLPIGGKSGNTFRILIALVLLLPIIYFLRSWLLENRPDDLIETFEDVSDDSLSLKSWLLHNPDSIWWSKRNRIPGHLSLYTHRGDNWSNDPEADKIKNLLYRKLTPDCFSAEIRFSEFFPKQNWQQAGILLSEDEGFTGKVLRLSIAYNNFFGGYEKLPEIIVQGLSSSETGNKSKPEEFAHFSLFDLRTEDENLVKTNLLRSALKIEKNDNHYRFLYATGSKEAFAFKEVISGDFSLKPRYIGLFAIRGLSDSTEVVPADFDYFRLVDLPCNK